MSRGARASARASDDDDDGARASEGQSAWTLRANDRRSSRAIDAANGGPSSVQSLSAHELDDDADGASGGPGSNHSRRNARVDASSVGGDARHAARTSRAGARVGVSTKSFESSHARTRCAAASIGPRQYTSTTPASSSSSGRVVGGGRAIVDASRGRGTLADGLGVTSNIKYGSASSRRAAPIRYT